MTLSILLQKPKERKIIFWQSSTWTRMVGWYQTVKSAAAILAILASSRYFELEIDAEFNSIMNLNLLLFLLVELNMGIGLLRGSYSKNMHMIRAWMVFSTFAAFIFPSCTVTDWIIGDNSEIGAFEIVSSVIGMFAEVLIVWIVGIHKKDIGVLIGRNS